MTLALVTALSAAVLAAGPLEIEIHTQRAAQRFHVVDQLSKWNLYAHAQYRRRLGPFSTDDEALLEKHAAIRKAHGYGDMDQTFYRATDLETALATAVKRHVLTPAEADVEREVITYFTPRIDAFLDADQALIDASVTRLMAHRSELVAFAKRASRFTGQPHVAMPLFLVPSGEKGLSGGGANGGVLVVEVPEDVDPFYTVVHESWHAFVMPRFDLLEAAAKRTPGLDAELLSEGLAYAIMPGLYRQYDDQLALQVRRDLDGKAAHGDEHARRIAAFNRYGLALRPLLAAALDDGRTTLPSFLPRACDAFRVLASLDSALDTNDLPSVFSFGPPDEALQKRALAKNMNVWGRPHGPDGYAVLSKARPKDLIVLRYTLADLSSVTSAAIRDLLPVTLPEIRAVLQRGGSVETDATRRGWKIVLLAAPDEAQLSTLVKDSKLLRAVLP